MSVLLLGLITTLPISADDRLNERREISDFVRMHRDSEGKLKSFQVAVTQYQSADGAVSVDLIGAVHVGDESYYNELNQRFAGYEAVLYELVVPEPDEPVEPPTGAGLIGALQGGLSGGLGLSHQLDVVDYEAPNLVHADMTVGEFSRSMQERGESFGGMFFRAAMAQQPTGEAERDLLFALLAKDRQRAFRVMMARQFTRMDSMAEVLEGSEGSTLVTERNAKALSVLRQQLQTGKKHLAIFYGAAHMPDFEERLIQDFELQLVGEQWVDAWDLRRKKQ